MTHKDSGWEPDGRAMQYDGDTVEDHAVGAGQVNVGGQDVDPADPNPDGEDD
jgi:hypothetical protein